MEVNTIIKQHDSQAIGGTDGSGTEGAVSNFQPLSNFTDNKNVLKVIETEATHFFKIVIETLATRYSMINRYLPFIYHTEKHIGIIIIIFFFCWKCIKRFSCMHCIMRYIIPYNTICCIGHCSV